MKQGKIDQPAALNPDRLNDELKAALGSKYISCDTGVLQMDANEKPDRTKPVQIIVRLTDDATSADTTAAEAVIAAHNPAVLSADQQKQKDRGLAYTRFKSFDFVALRLLKPAEQNPVIIDLLADIQKLMQGAE